MDAISTKGTVLIYVKQTYNLHPASPATRDEFVEVVQAFVLPANERLGARLVGGFFAHEEWYTQIVHVTEFADWNQLGDYRAQVGLDDDASRGTEILDRLAPEQTLEILEPLGPIAPAAVSDAIEASSAGTDPTPNGVYTFAILDVDAGKMKDFEALLEAANGQLPIIACWRHVSGNPLRIIDLWKLDTGRQGFRAADDAQNAFFEPLRRIAPREKMMRLHPMPYSPLQ